jgi:choline dehydrogenase-like flavoprotein
MGPDDRAVVDAQLCVHGIEALRVADASIFPHVVGGNTNAAVVMVAEKCADLMRGLPAPAALDLPYARPARVAVPAAETAGG